MFSKKIHIFLVTALVLLGIGLRFLDLEVKKRTPDEKVYAAYASEIAAHGVANTINLIDAYKSDASFWVYPPPTRVGYIYTQAAAMKFLGVAPERAGSLVSVFFSAASLVLVAFIGWYFFGPVISIFSCALLSVFPLDLALARRGWPDSALAFCATVLLCILLAAPKGKNNGVSTAVFCAAGVFAMLLKESGFIVFAFFAAALIAVLVRRKRFREALLTGAFALLAVETVFIVLKSVGGGFLTVAGLWRVIADSIAGNPYAAKLQRVSPKDLCLAFFSLSPGIAVFFLAGAVLAVKKKAAAALAATAVFLCSFVFLLASPYFHNFRYLSPAIAAYVLVAGSGAAGIFEILRRNKKTLFLAWSLVILLVFSLARDHGYFYALFVEKGVMDLTPSTLF